MTNFIPTEMTGNTIITSRTIQEHYCIENGTTAYGKLAALIDSNISSIDALIEYASNQIAQNQVKEKYESQHFDPKFGQFKNFMTRNIYLDPAKKAEMERSREMVGFITSLGTEIAFKSIIRGAQVLFQHIDKYKSLSQIYDLLNSFANEQTENADIHLAKTELGKIRNQLPLSYSEKKKLNKSVSMNLEDIPGITAFNSENSGKLRENISYLLYAIYCHKYGKYLQEHENDRRYEKYLLTYYDYLGYSGKAAEELLKENSETYNTITDQQKNYLNLARAMVDRVFYKIPEIDIDRIKTQSVEMAKYDPYSLRRKKVQTSGTAAAVTVGGLFVRSPMLVIQAGSVALSQLQLENNDNAAEFLEKTFKNSGIDTAAFKTMFEQSKIIRSTAQNMV